MLFQVKFKIMVAIVMMIMTTMVMMMVLMIMIMMVVVMMMMSAMTNKAHIHQMCFVDLRSIYQHTVDQNLSSSWLVRICIIFLFIWSLFIFN